MTGVDPIRGSHVQTMNRCLTLAGPIKREHGEATRKQPIALARDDDLARGVHPAAGQDRRQWFARVRGGDMEPGRDRAFAERDVNTLHAV